jgi:hypothetical protein
MGQKLYNLARMTSATTGTGTLTLGAAVSGYLSFSAAGIADQDVVFYGIADGGNCECGYGTYTASGTTLTRNPVKSSNSNAAINCSGSQQVYITAIAADGGDLLPGSVNPLRGFDAPINLQLNAANNGTKLTIAVKGNNGSDPGNTNPVLMAFRDPTAANGDPVWRAVTAALSVDTNAAGATLGTSNSVPFRLWVVAFDDAGTIKLALWQSVTGGANPTAIAPLDESSPQSATAFSGSANQAGTFYTQNGVAVPSTKSIRILGFVEYNAGLATAGTYNSNPTRIQLFGPGIKKPGDLVQTTYASVAVQTSNGSSSFVTALSGSITPTSTPNLVEAVCGGGSLVASPLVTGSVAIARGTNTPFVGILQFNQNGVGGPSINGCGTTTGWDLPQTTSSQTYNVRIKGDGTNNVVWPGVGASPNNGTLVLREIMA